MSLENKQNINTKQLLEQQILSLEKLLNDYSNKKPDRILHSTDQYNGIDINTKWRSGWWSQLNAVITGIESIKSLPVEITRKIDITLDNYATNKENTGLVAQENVNEAEELIKELTLLLKNENKN